MKFKYKFLILFLFMLCLIVTPIKVNAALQANGNSSKTDTIWNWLLNIRKMEETGGTLGLTDTINTTDLTSSASQSNNLDIHMQKNTEYGAMALLSASAYGNPNKINDGETTTGNKSGVYINLNNEWVSAGTISSVQQYTNANAKYKNIYTTSYVARAGDAIAETAGWHGSGARTWIDYNNNSGLMRATSGSLFSYYGHSAPSYFYIGAAWYSMPYHTRAVIVIGNGF